MQHRGVRLGEASTSRKQSKKQSKKCDFHSLGAQSNTNGTLERCPGEMRLSGEFWTPAFHLRLFSNEITEPIH